MAAGRHPAALLQRRICSCPHVPVPRSQHLWVPPDRWSCAVSPATSSASWAFSSSADSRAQRSVAFWPAKCWLQRSRSSWMLLVSLQ